MHSARLPIPDNRTYLPPLEEYRALLDQIWASGWVTNNGRMVQTLERELEAYLGVPFVRLVANGTMALQLGLQALGIRGEVITTPFSYVATTGSILWEQCTPVFVDVDPRTFNLDPALVEAAVTAETQAILPTHVFGVPCDIREMRRIADAHGLHLMYDGAHGFGTEAGGRSLLAWGDLSAVSFHATKLFHTVEGGAVVTDRPEVAAEVELMRAFGHRGNLHERPGINAKNSELHAAMGRCLLPRIDGFIAERGTYCNAYRAALQGLGCTFQETSGADRYNFAYMPILLPEGLSADAAQAFLQKEEICTRRYFTPSLNRLPYVDAAECPIAEEIARSVLCLPLFQGITAEEIRRVAGGLRACVESHLASSAA